MDLVYREMGALARYSEQLGPQIGIHKYQQWQFFRQWQVVKGYANDNGIAIFGDIPIFVAHDSVDVWANQHLFQLDETGKPTVVAGVPPDYFSKTGQLWGNPLYRWDAMALDGYGWWVARMRSACDLYDMLRIDHFRGFEAYWEVPATERTAVKGRWVKGPGEALFRAFLGALGRLPVVAEDLGVITPEVEELRDRFDLPGMKILQFAFGSGSDNPYLPHNHIRNSVVYTGTHDNDTTVGWFDAIKPKERKHIGYYLDVATLDMPWDLIRSAMASVADTAIIPLQDILGLGSEARMNLPGSATGNWSWRFGAKELNKSTASKLRKITQLYGRCKTST
jgi:4-alpha-glucanotransferase